MFPHNILQKNLDAHQQTNGLGSYGTYTQWNITQPLKKNSFEPVLMRWMELEPIIQSEVSQKDKDQIQYTNAYIWNFKRW